MLKNMVFCHLQENLVINMVKINGYCNRKTEIHVAKTASIKVVQETAEATGDLTGNKIADEVTSIGKPKEKEK